ncbi:unnamed protein product [Thelazia callipaeda]|uniref:Uncharacterized protein n=1 Tax=Thelazia callipaeda TaxID=103827 RepID=A0A0N5CTR6_THECL|nr:unnamed protein product [Thelazia callipaeda]
MLYTQHHLLLLLRKLHIMSVASGVPLSINLSRRTP